MQTITSAEIRTEQVARWGEAKVRENELDILRRFGRNAPAEIRERYGWTPKATDEMSTPELVREFTESKMRDARGERVTDKEHIRHCAVVDELRSRGVLD